MANCGIRPADPLVRTATRGVFSIGEAHPGNPRTCRPENLEDIARIADNGVETERDVQVVRMCMSFIAGYLHKRRHEAKQLDG